MYSDALHPWEQTASILRDPDLTAALLVEGDPVIDIVVALFWDTAFTRSRSSVTWLDSATPLLCSDLGPYDMVEDGLTGLKARAPEDFCWQLTQLVTVADLRRRIGTAAREKVLAPHGTAHLAALDAAQHLVAGERTGCGGRLSSSEVARQSALGGYHQTRHDGRYG